MCKKVPEPFTLWFPTRERKTMFWLNGALEFFDEEDNLLETLDVFWMMDHYLAYCREHGLKVNQKLSV
jgi:2,4'-dihydroxyacetophenone dioxygenase